MGLTGDPHLAVAYLRVSTGKQKLSREVQQAAIEAWAAREGIAVVAWHVDAGVSGGSDLDARPALVAALGALRAVHAGVLVVARRDRLARDVTVAATIEKATAATGARVVSADGAGNGESPADAATRSRSYEIAAHVAEDSRRLTKAALAAKRANGERAGEVPYGFTADAAGRLIPNATEQEVIAIVRELRAAGVALRPIVAELERRGLVSRAGRPLALTQVARLAKRTEPIEP